MLPPDFTFTADPSALWPLAVGRPLAGLVMAGQRLGDWQLANWHGQTIPGLWQRADAWVSAEDAAGLRAAGPGHVLIIPDGTPLAGIPWADPARPPVRLPAGPASFLLVHPWDLLRLNEQLVGQLGADDIRGELSPAAHINGRLVLGEESRVLPGVYIEGKVIIGRNCKIGPNCHVRGNTSIGDNCHIGQSVEIKNCLIGSRSHVGHLSYVGDSVLGDGVNLGAGTITANFRHDGKNHRSMVDGGLVDTGRRKFGAILGDGVHTGIHTSIYPGRKIGPGATTRPGEIVRQDRMSGVDLGATGKNPAEFQ